MKRALYLFVGMLFLGYFGGAYYFSGEITAYKVRSYDFILNENHMKGYQDVGLPPPEDVRVPSGAVTLGGWVFRNPKNRRCGVVMHHGHTSNRMGDLKYSKLFWPRGCHLFMFDARHHGSSTGAFATWGFREKQDLANMVNWFAQNMGLPHGKIAVFGESMGASISAQALPLLPDIAFAILDSPFRDLDSELKYRGTLLYGKPLLLLYPTASWIAGARGNFKTSDVSPLKAAAEAQIPVFITHSKDDDVIPFNDSQEIYNAIPHDRKAIYLTETGGHTSFMNKEPQKYKKLVDEFISRYAPGF